MSNLSVDMNAASSRSSDVAPSSGEEEDEPCDFAAFLAARLGIESENAALHVLGAMLREYQPLERRAIHCLARQRRERRPSDRHADAE